LVDFLNLFLFLKIHNFADSYQQSPDTEYIFSKINLEAVETDFSNLSDHYGATFYVSRLTKGNKNSGT